MGDFINTLLDNLLATLWRVLDLPLYAIVILMAAIMLVVTFALKKIFKRISNKRIWTINVIIAVLLVILIIDKKISNISKEVNFINEKVSNANMNEGQASISKVKIYNSDALKVAYPNYSIYEKPINEAIDLISLKSKSPNVVSYIAIIDLNHPNVEIKVSPEHKEKYKTSLFAKENDCVLAINGEAGLSSEPGCDLGEWKGNWISDGKVVMMSDTELRPFIGFSKNNMAHYSIESEIDTVLNAQKYNAIWGRFDILVNNQIVEHEGDYPYSRTVMGTNAEGSILYLMIVDGKRPDFSEGLTYYNCANMLQSLGASNAMACDQGGSSCMYVESMGGIINRPADSDGLERPIYSHFGISMR